MKTHLLIRLTILILTINCFDFINIKSLKAQNIDWEQSIVEKTANISNAYEGNAVAMDGDVAIVGAVEENNLQGAAYIYVRNPLNLEWEFRTRLFAANGNADDRFGFSVAIDGNRAVVGAWLNDDAGYNVGKVYVFDMPANGWPIGNMFETAQLLPTADHINGQTYFGHSVDISGNTVVAGALDHANWYMGAAFLFDVPQNPTGIINQTTNFQRELQATSYGTFFGYSVAINEDASTVVIGAPDGQEEYHGKQGQAFVFERPADGWPTGEMTETAELTSNYNATNSFGQWVDISGNNIIIGCQHLYNFQGAALYYERPGNQWVDTENTTMLIASDGYQSDYFGHAVAIQGNTVLVGAPKNDINSPGVNWAGAVYVFENAGEGGDANLMRTETVKIRACESQDEDEFGSAVAFSGDQIVVGAIGDGNDFSTGAAHFFGNKCPQVSFNQTFCINEDGSLTISIDNFTITDPDEGDTLNLQIEAGDNYTFDGFTIYPNPGFSGQLMINVTIDDSVCFVPFSFPIDVNDCPDVTVNQQQTYEINEGESFEVTFDHFTVVDNNNNYPADFTLTVLDDPALTDPTKELTYIHVGNVVTPAATSFGEITVFVKISDGKCDAFAELILINNDCPRIVSCLIDEDITEDTEFFFNRQNFHILDANDTDLTVTILDGDHYTVTGPWSILPDPNYDGSLEILFQTTDGKCTSEIFTLPADIVPVNDAPVIVSNNLPSSILEDTPLNISINDLVIDDPDNTIEQITLTILGNNNYSVDPINNSFITPDLNYNGIINIQLQVKDLEHSSAVYFIPITVIPVNDAPEIIGQNNISPIAMNSSYTLQLGDLFVTDPDHNYPSDFNLYVLGGSNYTVSGTTITPNANFSGNLSVEVYVRDGSNDASNKYFVSINVIENNKPEILGQNNLQVLEENDMTIQLSDLIVSDSDHNFPNDFTLTVLGGSNYSVSGNTITPSVDYNGNLSVPVYVSDGIENSDIYYLNVTVNSVNDCPTITNSTSHTMLEDGSFEIELSFLTVSDPDNSFPSDYSLQVQSGNYYTVSGNIITTYPHYNGPLEVKVTVKDGECTSNVFIVPVTVTSVNDAPIITGQYDIIINNTESYTFDDDDLKVTDPDHIYPIGFDEYLSPGANYTLSGKTVTPNSGFVGVVSVPVQVNDGIDNSNVYPLLINVVAPNIAPVITGQQNLSTNEEISLTLSLNDFTVNDPDNNYPQDFTLTVSDGNKYSRNGNTITPNQDFNGTLSVPVQVNDGSASSGIFNAQITVTAVNDCPEITNQSSLVTTEDTPITIQLTDVSVNDPDNNFPQDYSLTVLNGNNYSVSGNMVTPSSNFVGLLTVPVYVNDGACNSNTYNLSISVNSVNDCPEITNQASLETDQDTPLTIELSDIIVNDPDNNFPQDFTLEILNGSNYSVSGTTITPSNGFSGILSVQSRVSDGLCNSDIYALSVTVNATNLCSAPLKLTTNVISTDRAAISWDAISGAVKYEVSYYNSNGFGNETIYIVLSPEIILGEDTPLEENTSYTVKVRSVCSLDGSLKSNWSKIATFTTLKTSGMCPIPNSLRARTNANNSVNLRWEASGLPVEYYIVRYRTTSSLYWDTYLISNYFSYVNTPILSQGDYVWQVASVCNNRGVNVQSSWSSSSYFTISGLKEGGRNKEFGSETFMTQYKAYPNPFTDRISIDVSHIADENIELRIINSSGIVVYQKDNYVPNETLDLCGKLPSGVYILQVKNGTEVKNLRIVRQ